MTNQILDRRTIGIPGGTGDVTPELLAARDTAVESAERASGSRADAERATSEANRAERAASSVDMVSINQRLDGMDTNIGTKADLVGGRVPNSQLNAGSSATQGTVPVRVAGGRLPGIGTPTADSDAAPKAYVDLLGKEAEDREANFAAMQDLIIATRINSTLAGSMDLSSSQVYSLVTAPQDMRIVGASLAFDQVNAISGGTNVMTARLFHRLHNDEPARNIVQKTTQQEAISQRYRGWSLTNGSWGSESDLLVPAGNTICLIFTFAGSAKLVFPVTATLEWRPVR